ncbi:MAG: heavy metal translocating P-type ATPase [Saprospiraceae bacterium]|jgi:Cu2+-exporting ATPase|nr:heavy metal translocating P-type ATPase [Saprospiraceae bacterium]
MNHTYEVTGMTCNHCVQTVKKTLENIHGIQSAKVTLDPPQAVITMHHHISTEEMNAALAESGNYSLEMAKHENHVQHQGHDMKNHGDHANRSKHEGHGEHNHHDHHRMMIEDFKKRFWVSLILTIPVLLLSPMIQNLMGVNWAFSGSMYVLFALSSVIYFYGGWPFLKGLKDELSKKSPGMMTLIAVAISAAYLYSSAVVFGLVGKTFFWELATLIDVMLLGHWLEMRSVLGASKALEALAALMPDEANLIHGDHIMKVKVSELKQGDIILIKPGEKVPADGEITEGESDLNESMLTGESMPVKKSKGQEVIGGSINGSGSIKVKIKGTGDDTYLSKVIQMVQEAQGQKSKTQRLADKAAYWLTIIALVAGFGTFAAWLLMGSELSFALERMVTVMVICCPHALGLAIPLVAAISTSISAKNGLLIRNRTAFENSRNITTIVFDKTGTLTKGSHEVVRIVSLSENYNETEILKYAAAVESPSEHHISKGLQRKAKAENLKLPSVQNFKYESGVGVNGKVNGKSVQAGGFVLMEKLNLTPPEDEKEAVETKIFLIIENELVGFITFADEIRESSFDAIKTLQNNGIKVSLLTGDNEKVAAAVAKELNMDDYMAEVLPDQKLDKIKALQSKGEFVAMTGDGVNDAPALAQAGVGIAIGSGTDVAAETADIILVESDPKDIANLLLFGKATYRKMVQNLAWATGYNMIALPLATGFIPGFMISPAFGAALMSVSTIICAVNAQLLKREMV